MDLSEFQDLLKREIGLDSATIGSPVIERAVHARVRACGLNGWEEYGHLVQSSREELQHLIEEVVVSETWFFRDPEAFQVLSKHAQEEWLPAHSGRSLRVLSMPCATGEEPYSIAMALLDAGIPAERIAIDAGDVSKAALALAARAVYGANSFRSRGLTFRDRYFQAAQEKYTLLARVARLVNFHRANITGPNLPFAGPYDAIFCRNLLIYTDRPDQRRILATLRDLLSPYGLLFVGPSEAYAASQHGFAAAERPGAFAFRKTEAPRSAPHRVKAVHTPPRPKPRPRISSMARKPAIQGPQTLGPPSLDVLETARSLADQGRLKEAAENCEGAIRAQGPSADLYYLLGVIRDANGDRQSAAEHYRKVLYLDPRHTDALIHLAALVEQQGDRTAAQRLRDRAREADSAAAARGNT